MKAREGERREGNRGIEKEKEKKEDEKRKGESYPTECSRMGPHRLGWK